MSEGSGQTFVEDLRKWRDKVLDEGTDLEGILTDPRLVAEVERRTRKSIQAAPDIPIRCGDHETGYGVRLSAAAGRVRVQYVSTPERVAADVERGLTTGCAGLSLVFQPVAPLELHCAVCGAYTPMKPERVVRAAVVAMVGRHRWVQVGSTARSNA